MNASSNLVSIRPSDYDLTALSNASSSYATAELTRRVETELLSTELGDEFIGHTLRVAPDGMTFTLRAKPNTAIIVGRRRVRISGGDKVKFNRDLEALYVAQKSRYSNY